MSWCILVDRKWVAKVKLGVEILWYSPLLFLDRCSGIESPIWH